MAEFQDSEWYPARLEPSSKWDESPSKRTPMFKARFLITRGEMAGNELVGEWYMSEKAVERTAQRLEVLGFNIYDEDLTTISRKIAGVECEVKAQVENDVKYGRKCKAGDVRPPGTPGGPEALAVKIAEMIGNTVTSAAATEVAAGNDNDDEPRF